MWSLTTLISFILVPFDTSSRLFSTVQYTEHVSINVLIMFLIKLYLRYCTCQMQILPYYI
jgi:hypothetical protein